MIRPIRPLAEITTEAFNILYREIGIVDTLRFISQYTTGSGDYTAERDQLFGDMILDDVVSEIKQTRMSSDMTKDAMSKEKNHKPASS